MPQHLWIGASHFRLCEVCQAYQVDHGSRWEPSVPPICPGDDDDDDKRPRRRPRPIAPSGAPRTLEVV